MQHRPIRLGPQVHLVEAMNKMMVAVPGGHSFIVDLKTLALSEFEFPGGPMNVSLSGDLVLRCRCNKSGLWVATWESRDEGKTWQEIATESVLTVARLNMTFTADDVWAWLESHSLPQPPNKAALGAVFKALAKDNQIRVTGEWRNSARPETHTRPLRVWQQV